MTLLSLSLRKIEAIKESLCTWPRATLTNVDLCPLLLFCELLKDCPYPCQRPIFLPELNLTTTPLRQGLHYSKFSLFTNIRVSIKYAKLIKKTKLAWYHIPSISELCITNDPPKYSGLKAQPFFFEPSPLKIYLPLPRLHLVLKSPMTCMWVNLLMHYESFSYLSLHSCLHFSFWVLSSFNSQDITFYRFSSYHWTFLSFLLLVTLFSFQLWKWLRIQPLDIFLCTLSLFVILFSFMAHSVSADSHIYISSLDFLPKF